MNETSMTTEKGQTVAVGSDGLLGAPWKDVTTYSRGDKDRIPKTWSAEFGRLRISVTRNINYGPDAWVVMCHKLGIEKQLDARALQAAAAEAIEVVKSELDSLRRSFA